MLLMIRLMLVLIVLTSGSVTANIKEAPSGEAPLSGGAWQPTSTEPAALGLEIFTEADRRESGYGDLQVQLRMILRSNKGRETERRLRIKQLEMEDDGDRVIAVFDAPANIRGTALLSHAHPHTDDDQWLYLPAVKRTKKIASRNKTGSFVGSEFSFEDLTPLEVGKYTYEFLRIEACAAGSCFVVNRFPRDPYSGYSKQTVWLDTVELRMQKIEYTDKRDRLEKRLLLSDYELHAKSFHKAGFMRMENLLTGRSTDLHWQNYEFQTQLETDRDFSVNALRRAR